ncbi:MAG: HtaA domain-containing protein [Corynebacterium sp.]|uniref:HtaA domain-containing protein n=1 Tax=Corynebacterium sp. TaxID=1720 RepID=UPI0026DB8BAD|nr:HtaA domain-containing protein [Corynebacterium sp.]MDO4760794.1 HtaA domain-containing protein [Corynebacterium sp.]
MESPHVRRRLIASILTLSLAPLTPAALAQENTPHMLTWGLRESFNSYTNGATFVRKGATEDKANAVFQFPLTSYTYDAKEEKAVAQFKGEIVYRKYCNGKDPKVETNYCDLDLTISDPKVVIDDDGSYLYATVRSKQYLKNETYTNDGTEAIAQLATGAGNFTKDNGVVSWSKIPATLTKGGTKVFSNFYEPGGSLAPISFSAQGEGERPSNDSSPLRAVDAKWTSPASYDNYRHDLYRVGSKTLVSVGGHGLYLLDSTLKEVAKVQTPHSLHGVGAFDEKNGYFYYSERPADTRVFAGHSNTLKRIQVTSTGFGTPEVVGDPLGNVYAIAVHPKTNQIVALSVENNVYNVAVNDRHAHLHIIENGVIAKSIKLPNSETVLGGKVTEDGTVYANLYANRMQATHLKGMDDGTFLYYPQTELKYDKHPGVTQTGIFLSIKPDAEQDDVVKLMDGSIVSSRIAPLEGFSAHGNQIVRYTHNEHHDHNFVQSFTYADRNVTQVSLTKSPKTGWSNVSWDAAGNPFVLVGPESKLLWFDTTNFAPVKSTVNPTRDKEAGIEGGNGTQDTYQGEMLVYPNGSVLVPTVNRNSDNLYELIRLEDPSSAPLPGDDDGNDNQYNEDKLKYIAKTQLQEKTRIFREALTELKAAQGAKDDARINAAKAKVDEARAAFTEAKADYLKLHPGSYVADPEQDNTSNPTSHP